MKIRMIHNDLNVFDRDKNIKFYAGCLLYQLPKSNCQHSAEQIIKYLR